MESKQVLIPEKTHRALRLFAAKNMTSMMAVVDGALRRSIDIDTWIEANPDDAHLTIENLITDQPEQEE